MTNDFVNYLSVNGNWSGWGEWSTCPGFCGSSFVNRTRKCDDPPPEHGGANCTGPAVDVKECNHSQRCTGMLISRKESLQGQDVRVLLSAFQGFVGDVVKPLAFHL